MGTSIVNRQFLSLQSCNFAVAASKSCQLYDFHTGTTTELELELELIQTQMTPKPMLRAEVGMRVRCANKASAECIMRGRGIGQNSRKNCKKRGICG